MDTHANKNATAFFVVEKRVLAQSTNPEIKKTTYQGTPCRNLSFFRFGHKQTLYTLDLLELNLGCVGVNIFVKAARTETTRGTTSNQATKPAVFVRCIYMCITFTASLNQRSAYHVDVHQSHPTQSALADYCV